MLQFLLIVFNELFFRGLKWQLEIFEVVFKVLFFFLNFSDVLHIVSLVLLVLVLFLIAHLFLLLLVILLLFAHISLSGTSFTSNVITVELVLILNVLNLLNIYLDFTAMRFLQLLHFGVEVLDLCLGLLYLCSCVVIEIVDHILLNLYHVALDLSFS